MSKITDFLVSIGALLSFIVGLFFYSRNLGKKAANDEQRKKILHNIQIRHKTHERVGSLSDTALDDELRDKDTRQ